MSFWAEKSFSADSRRANRRVAADFFWGPPIFRGRRIVWLTTKLHGTVQYSTVRQFTGCTVLARVASVITKSPLFKLRLVENYSAHQHRLCGSKCLAVIRRSLSRIDVFCRQCRVLAVSGQMISKNHLTRGDNARKLP